MYNSIRIFIYILCGPSVNPNFIVQRCSVLYILLHFDLKSKCQTLCQQQRSGISSGLVPVGLDTDSM